ncbi:hypothetical protein [Burkholderia sola]
MLLVYATGASRNGTPLDLTFVSSDAGKTRSSSREKPTQGGYFNAQTNALYSLVAYTLKKRQF